MDAEVLNDLWIRLSQAAPQDRQAIIGEAIEKHGTGVIGELRDMLDLIDLIESAKRDRQTRGVSPITWLRNKLGI